jgi:hypothetical protein
LIFFFYFFHLDENKRSLRDLDPSTDDTSTTTPEGTMEDEETQDYYYETTASVLETLNLNPYFQNQPLVDVRGYVEQMIRERLVI